MSGLGLVEGPSMINPSEQPSGVNPSRPGKEPVTPELGNQEANRSRFGLPTPDATPESQRIAPGGRKQSFVHLASQGDTGYATPSDSSRAPSVEETTINRDYSQHFIQSDISDQASERPHTRPISEPYLHREKSHPVSFVKLVFSSLVSFLNLAKQIDSRADNARVQSTINLIKSIPAIRRTRVGNVRTTLTAKQYEKLLRAIEESEDEEFRSYCIDKLRFDYTRHKKRFEILMPTRMHERLGYFIQKRIILWASMLESSTDPKIVKAAKNIEGDGSTDVKFPFPKGISDSKSPDISFSHTNCECKPRCNKPSLVIEIGWAQDMKKLRQKAEAYICRTGGRIRTVVGVCMRKMYLAELRNENRLYRMYMDGEVDDSESYPTDERNETGGASVIVWRAVTDENGIVKAVCVQDEEFRDENGRAVESCSLRLRLQDFVCNGLANADFEEQLEIRAEALCESVDGALADYREERGEIKREEAEIDKEKRAKGAAQKKKTRTRGFVDRTPNDTGILGRISERGGRLLSARLRRQETVR
ncbi:hypothetical protein F5Y03DRAFT_407975 [Xylaria venustula]|nr:hypothetical protein F5Y03DRAFT_407975 [Xylaria venustula]